jgi:predicted GNAT family N-acyltransferase
MDICKEQFSRTMDATISSLQQEYHQLTLKGCNYIVRGLLPEELDVWASFCARIFSYKSNPPSSDYFRRHFVNDPDHGSTSLIRVALYQEGGQIVSSCRIFLRQLSLGTIVDGNLNTFSAGGIGEVCTDPSHRRKGLSKALLQNSIAIMKERRLQVSLLHASPEFFPVYEQSCGYRCSKSDWVNVKIDIAKLHSWTDASAMMVRRAKFPRDSEQLHCLHQRYSEHQLSGCIARSRDYWNNYLRVEFEQYPLYVLVSNCDAVEGWLSIRPNETMDSFQVREFGVDQEKYRWQDAIVVLCRLLRVALKNVVPMKSHRMVTIQVPKFVAPSNVKSVAGQTEMVAVLPEIFDWSSATPKEDNGWMYLALNEAVELSAIDGTDESKQCRHFIWPSDSF